MPLSQNAQAVIERQLFAGGPYASSVRTPDHVVNRKNCDLLAKFYRNDGKGYKKPCLPTILSLFLWPQKHIASLGAKKIYSTVVPMTSHRRVLMKTTRKRSDTEILAMDASRHRLDSVKGTVQPRAYSKQDPTIISGTKNKPRTPSALVSRNIVVSGHRPACG